MTDITIDDLDRGELLLLVRTLIPTAFTARDLYRARAEALWARAQVVLAAYEESNAALTEARLKFVTVDRAFMSDPLRRSGIRYARAWEDFLAVYRKTRSIWADYQRLAKASSEAWDMCHATSIGGRS